MTKRLGSEGLPSGAASGGEKGGAFTGRLSALME